MPVAWRIGPGESRTQGRCFRIPVDARQMGIREGRPAGVEPTGKLAAHPPERGPSSIIKPPSLVPRTGMCAALDPIGVSMTENVVKFYPANAAESADSVLEQAIGDYDSVLIIGWDKDGMLDARATLNLKDGGEILWLLESFKFKLMSGDYAE